MIYKALKADLTTRRYLQVEYIAIGDNESPCNVRCFFGRNVIAERDHNGLFVGIPTALGYLPGVELIFSNSKAVNWPLSSRE